MACMSISEHQGYDHFKGYLGGDRNLTKHRFLGIGPLFETQHSGLLLNKLKVPDKDKPRLGDISNKLFLKALTGNKSKEQSQDTKDKLDFDQKLLLEQSLIIPGYFNNEPRVVFEYINMTANAPMTDPYKEYVFVLNKGNTYENIEDYLKGIPVWDLKLSPHIKTLQITTKVGDKIVEKVLKIRTMILKGNKQPFEF